MMRYEEALSRCLEAVAEGRDLEAVIAELPRRHRERLRQDAALTEALRRHAATLPTPSPSAEANALSRLRAELSSARDARETPATRSHGFFGLPRFALAGLVLAALLIGGSFLVFPDRAGDGTVEAAEFEGLVVANQGGRLTVQTLDTLEEVLVPLDAAVLDADGAALTLDAIAAGEVVIVRGNREGPGPVRAQDVRRRLDGLPGWCDDNAERCRRIAENLRDTQARCQDAGGCPPLRDLIDRATDVLELEGLKQRCRDGGEGCRDITSFCRQNPDSCPREAIDAPGADRLEEARERLRRLDGLCNDRDIRACRQIAAICQEHPALCQDRR